MCKIKTEIEINASLEKAVVAFEVFEVCKVCKMCKMLESVGEDVCVVSKWRPDL